jgi:hypothetical protein
LTRASKNAIAGKTKRADHWRLDTRVKPAYDARVDKRDDVRSRIPRRALF